MKSQAIALLATVLLVLGSCTNFEEPGERNEANVPEIRPSAPDGRRFFDWSDQQLKQTIRLAEQGDIEAARSLWGYYDVWENPDEFERWEQWLVDHNDGEALLIRAEKRYGRALDLPDSDDRKLENLDQADKLMKRLRATREKEDVPEADFHRMIQTEREKLIARTASQ